jgi:uncharacterized protein YndB with AHSA1/START domain
MSITTAKPSLTLKRRINAAPAKVLAAWIDPAKVSRWMGPEGVVVLGAEIEARAGGRYCWTMRSPDGETHEVSGVYREIVPDRKLVFTWTWKSTPERESIVTVTFTPDGDGTILTLTHEQLFDEDVCARHQHGWIGSLDKLEKFVAA